MAQMVLRLFYWPHLLVLLQATLLPQAVVVVVKIQLPQILEAHQVVVREAQVPQHHQEFLVKAILEVLVLVEALNLAVVAVVQGQKQ
jgi:hypothetical protein